MKILHVDINDKIATYRQRDGSIVCGNSDYMIEFHLDEEWQAHDKKTARFVIKGTYKDVEFTGTSCPVPVIMNTDTLQVGLYAGVLATTTSADIPCLRSVRCEGAPAEGFPVFLGISEDDARETFANAIVASATGTSLRLEDVSPTRRKLRAWLNGTIDPNGGAQIFTCGKNILPKTSVAVAADVNKVIWSGSIVGSFCFAFTDKREAVPQSHGVFEFIVNGTPVYATKVNARNYNSSTGTRYYAFAGHLTQVKFVNWDGGTGGSIDDIQLEIGSTPTDFEPYKQGEIIAANAYEDVELTSISPTLTIYTDHDMADITVKYNQDTNAVIKKIIQAITSLGGNV